ncbi:hypothetical protein [Marinobacterium arenosum]|uniref:hypothetical protein n=1 Tax=Marinobacterium arenosum TaxID=2862496 RepID=UPI001C971753|nr:hypothetical protein [Marinobacterium arenosum]MBY4676912.1 hypothetical protein [Marinobacterium arenosum]
MKTAAITLVLGLALAFTGAPSSQQPTYNTPALHWLAMNAMDAQTTDKRHGDDYRHNWEADWNDAH